MLQFFTSYLSVIPGPCGIELPSLVSRDLGPISKPTIKYSQLHTDSSHILGQYIGCQILRMNFPRDIPKLEDLCSSFCMKLNSVFDMRTIDKGTLGIVAAMLGSLLGAILGERPDAPLQAQFTQCLVSRISISRLKRSQDIIETLLHLCKEKHFAFCAHTLNELQDVCTLSPELALVYSIMFTLL